MSRQDLLRALQARIQFVGQINEYLEGVTTNLISNTTSYSHSDDDIWRYTLEAAIIGLDSNGKDISVKLRRERNDLVPATKLSDEVLGRVMSYGKMKDAVRWSWVCRRWRQAALNSPELWTQIELKGRTFDQDILLMQLDRSGTHPLDIDFGEMGDRYALFLPHRILASLLSRSRSLTHLTPLIWMNAGISGSFEMPYLEILEAVIGFEVGADSIICLQNSPKLQHLSLKGSLQILFPGLTVGPYLRTVYLSTASGHPTAVLFFLSRLPNLKELYLISMLAADNPGRLDHATIMESTTFPNLDFLCIKHCPGSYISGILIPPLITPDTNVYLEADTPESPIRLDRGGMVSTLWVDTFRRNSFLIGHQTSLTEILLKEDDNAKLLSQLPVFINCYCITTIDLNGYMPTSDELNAFPSLARLTILFAVSPADIEKRSLDTTLNQAVPMLCPQLQYIGLILRRMGPQTAAYIDGAAPAVEEFLNHWVRVHGKRFGTIRIQDEINPSRWSRRLVPLFETMLQSFELGDITNQESNIRPKFPATRHTYRTKLKLADLRI
ncbi:hypothetical protein CPB86DRAFT_786521 [Serendipita vermifera]|nr:hypothetical protein CPB86DRAFT_786521 [Serendipita vermifera]